MARKVRTFCKACGEPTTHERRTIDGKPTYVCLMCEAGKSRPKEEVDKIRETRKGWAAPQS